MTSVSIPQRGRPPTAPTASSMTRLVHLHSGLARALGRMSESGMQAVVGENRRASACSELLIPGGPCRRRLDGREGVRSAVGNERRHREGRQVRPEVSLGVDASHGQDGVRCGPLAQPAGPLHGSRGDRAVWPPAPKNKGRAPPDRR